MDIIEKRVTKGSLEDVNDETMLSQRDRNKIARAPSLFDIGGDALARNARIVLFSSPNANSGGSNIFQRFRYRLRNRAKEYNRILS